jgi:hypothetical protein
MDEALRRAGWIALSVIATGYVTFAASDAVFNSREASSTPVVVRDVLSEGEHHLYGKILVASSCDEVTIKTDMISTNKYELSFTTWREPEAICIQAPTERVFDTIIFAPTIGVNFSAKLDDTEIPIAVYPILSN